MTKPKKTSSKKSCATGFDVVVIGGGSAGLSAAFSARSHGVRVALVVDGMLGGECPNYACVPMKAMLAAAVRYDDLRRNAESFGIIASRVRFDLELMMNRKHAVVRAMTGGGRIEKMLQKEGITLFHGTGSFVDRDSLRVGTHVISAKAFVIATGSVPKIPPIANLETIEYWTPRDVTSMEALPESVAIVGGGPVGCEFATFFSLLGISVTIFDVADQLLPYEDGEVVAIAQKALHDRGVVVHTSTKVLGATSRRGQVTLTYQTKTAPRTTVTVDRVILASGRVPNVAMLNLDCAGVKRNAQGNMGLDATLRARGTKCFFAGDVTGFLAFTHTAHEEGVVAGENAVRLAKNERAMKRVDLSVVPYVIFTSPELASVGKPAEELAREGIEFSVLKFPIGALGRSVIERRRSGLLKVCVEKKTDQILGASLVGERSGEVIHEIALAMHAHIPFSTVQSMIHAYPTMNESIKGLMSV